ncbi:hypothetical protein LCGC14_1822360, partial [marine sediment metagenome]
MNRVATDASSSIRRSVDGSNERQSPLILTVDFLGAVSPQCSQQRGTVGGADGGLSLILCPLSLEL